MHSLNSSYLIKYVPY